MQILVLWVHFLVTGSTYFSPTNWNWFKNIVVYIYNLTSSWIGSGVSYEVKKAPYDYITHERILEAIDNMIASGELFNLEQDVQERAAAFYLNSLGKVSYDGHITQKDAIAFLEEKKAKQD